jgi:hypothetical protein
VKADETAIVCDLTALSASERAHRAALAERLFARFHEVRETDDGYAARLDAAPETCREALEWLLLERRCCPFLRLALRLEAADGPLWLHFGGPPGTKAFLVAAGLAPGTRPPASCEC